MTGPLVLIEPYAHRLGGHHQHALVALAAVGPGAVVVTLGESDLPRARR